MILPGDVQGNVYDERFLDLCAVTMKITTFLDVILYK